MNWNLLLIFFIFSLPGTSGLQTVVVHGDIKFVPESAQITSGFVTIFHKETKYILGEQKFSSASNISYELNITAPVASSSLITIRSIFHSGWIPKTDEEEQELKNGDFWNSAGNDFQLVSTVNTYKIDLTLSKYENHNQTIYIVGMIIGLILCMIIAYVIVLIRRKRSAAHAKEKRIL